MCLGQRLEIKMVFWSIIISLLIFMGAMSYTLYESINMRVKFEHYRIMKSLMYYPNFYMVLTVFALAIALTAFASIILDWYPLLIIHAYLFIFMSMLMIFSSMSMMSNTRDAAGGGSKMLDIIIRLDDLLENEQWFSFNKTILDTIQRDLKCCGVVNWKDYWTPLRRAWIGDMLPLPKSCCDDQKLVCMPLVKTVRQDGCRIPLGMFISMTMIKDSCLLISFGITCGMNAAFIFILARRAKEYYFFYPYYIP